jgi:branched-chain amino acid transport system permease protein
MTEFINFYLVPGLVLGSIYALGAIGLSLVYGVLRFANFAHGELMTLGAYGALTVKNTTGWPILAALPISMALTAFAGVVIDRWFYRPFRARPTIVVVIASFGMALMVRSLVQLFWGVGIRSYSPGHIQKPWLIFDTLRLQPKHLAIFLAALVLMAGVHWLLKYTRMGKAMRAMSDSPELARLTGIDTESVVRVTWLAGTGLAAAAGVFLGLDTQLNTNMGFFLLLPVFAAAILGGIGRPYGAMAGGMVIGLAEELSAYPWIGETPLLSPGYKAGVAFAIMIGMLIWRPSGLFRGSQF